MPAGSFLEVPPASGRKAVLSVSLPVIVVVVPSGCRNVNSNVMVFAAAIPGMTRTRPASSANARLMINQGRLRW